MKLRITAAHWKQPIRSLAKQLEADGWQVFTGNPGTIIISDDLTRLVKDGAWFEIYFYVSHSKLELTGESLIFIDRHLHFSKAYPLAEYWPGAPNQALKICYKKICSLVGSDWSVEGLLEHSKEILAVIKKINLHLVEKKS